MANINVSNDSQLTTALTSTANAGDTITLAAGGSFASGGLDFSNLDFASEVTLTTDPDTPATLGRISLVGCKGVGLENLRFQASNALLTSNSSGPAGGQSGAAIYIAGGCDGIRVERCVVRGAGNPTANTAQVTYAGVRAIYSQNVTVRGCDIAGFRYLILPTNCNGVTVWGNYMHDWSVGDAIQVQGCRDVTFSENYVAGAYRPPWSHPVSGVHMDSFQSSAGLGGASNANFTIERNYICTHAEAVFPQFGQSTPHQNWTQAFLVGVGGGTLTARDNVVFGAHLNAHRFSSFASGVVENNTIIQNPGAELSETAQKPAIIIGGGSIRVEDNISHGFTSGTQTGNLRITTPPSAAQGFPGISGDGTETFDDLRAAPGSSIVTGSKGSLYTRGLTDPSGYTEPMGYRVYQGTAGQAPTSPPTPTPPQGPVLSAAPTLIVSITGEISTPAAFANGAWSVADTGTGGSAQITITSLPDDGGSSLTGLQARIDNGPWQTLSGITLGDYTLTGLTNGTTAQIRLRALNAVGASPASAPKSVTTSAPVTGGGTSLLPGPRFTDANAWQLGSAYSITGGQLVCMNAPQNNSTYNAQGTDADVGPLSSIDYAFEVASGDAGKRVRFELRWYTAEGASAGSSRVPASTVSLSGGAQTISGSQAVPANADKMELRIQAIDVGMSFVIDSVPITAS